MLPENTFPSHCVRVPKLFDWVNRSTLIKLKESVQLAQETETNAIRCNFYDIKHTKCYLSDSNGHPVSRCTASCKELTSPNDRTNVQIMTPAGKLVTLQRIDLLKQGFVTVQFFHRKGSFL